jgi:hypothetical protein
MSAYDERAFAMAVAEEVETLGRGCDATSIVVDLPTGERVRFTPHGTWVIFGDDRPAYALEAPPTVRAVTTGREPALLASTALERCLRPVC